MSSSAYAKIYVFGKDGKIRGNPNDKNCDYMKSCISLQDWDDEFESLNFSLPENIEPQNVEQIGFISPESKIRESDYFISEDENKVTVSEMFDKTNYNDFIKTTITDDELNNGWKPLKRKLYQYNGIWVNYDILENAINSYNSNLEKDLKKFSKLEEAEFELKYKSPSFESILKELKDIKRILSKGKEDTDEEEDTSSIERIEDEISFIKDDIDELKYKISACSRLMGMMDYVYTEQRKDYTDNIYTWLYLC